MEPTQRPLQSFRGGLAEKLGNAFESDWAVQQAMLVLQSDAQSLTIEPIVGAEGFEFILTTKQGPEYHQCKRRGPRAHNWTIGAIVQTGFFTSAISRHQLDPTASFVFVSTDSSGDASRLSEHARRFSTLPEFQMALSQDDRTALSDLVTKTDLANDDDAYGFLKRTRFETVSELFLRDSNAREARRLFRGDGRATCDVLRRCITDNLTQTLSTERLRTLANERNLAARPAALDATTLERMARQNARYEASHGMLGVSDKFIPRPIATLISDTLQPGGDADFVVLTGVAGAGKSGVLRQAAQALEGDGVPCLRLRLDSLLQFTSAEELGASLFGPNESPALTLSLAAPENRFAVLILDQLDAVSEASGRTIEARELALDLIGEARHYHNLKVIVACRSYDLETDRRLRNLGEGPRAKRFNAELLDTENEVKPFLERLGVAHEGISAGQWDLIRLPVNLVHFAQLCLETKSVISAGSTSELYRALLDQRAKDLRPYKLSWSLPEVLGVLAERMSDTRTLTAPVMLIDEYNRAAELLTSGHLLNPDGDVVRFAHESLFDYCFARAFVRRGLSLVEWLVLDEQILFRRTQVRQVLQLLRSAERARYLEELEALLKRSTIRAHIKDAVSSWLGTLTDPSAAELDICLKLDAGAGEPSYIIRRIFVGAPWVKLLHERGLVTAWLASPDPERKQFALGLLDAAVDGEGALAAEVLRSWWDNDIARIPELLQWLRHPRAGKDMAAIADLYVDVIARTPDKVVEGGGFPDAADLGMWAHHGSPEVARLLEAWIDRWYRAHPTGHPFVERHVDEAYWLRETAKAHPVAFLETIFRAFSTAFTREFIDETVEPRYRSAFRVELPDDDEGEAHDERYILDIVRTTLRSLASTDPEATIRLLALLQPSEHFAALHLTLEAIDAGGAPFVKIARHLLDHPLLFDVGYEEGPSDSGARAIAAVWDALTPNEREQMEWRLLSHFPEMPDAMEAAQETIESHRLKRTLMYLGNVGAAQRNILARIGEERLSPLARLRLLALSRKFPNATWPEPYSRGGIVKSPISLERAKLMSDRHWLGAIKKHDKNRNELRYTRSGVVGGIEQLARVLQECTKLDPTRFVALAEQFPPGTPSDYARAVVRGVAESEATDDTAMRAAQIAISSTDEEMTRALSYLVSRHPALGRHDQVFDEIERLAHALPSPADGEPGIPRKRGGVESVQELVHAAGRHESLALNSARGDAIHSLAAMLWHAPERYDRVLALTQSLMATEAAIGTRVALVRCVHAIAGNSPDEGVTLLLALTAKEPTPLATGTGLHLISWTYWNRRESGLTLLDRLFAVEEFRPAALYLLAHYAAEDDDAAVRFEPLWNNDALARRMAAYAAVKATGDRTEAPSARVQQWLGLLFNDADEQVLKEAAGYGRNLAGEGPAVRQGLALAHVASPSFRVDPDDLLHGLDKLGAGYPDVVVAACKAFFEAEKDPQFRDRQRGGTGRHWLAKMIFAAYPALEKKPAYRAEILDAIDLFLASDLADARRELAQFERN